MKRGTILLALTLAAIGSTAVAQSGEVGGGLSFVLSNDHFDGGGGVFVYGAVRPETFYSLRGTLTGWTADTHSDLLWPAQFSSFGIEGTMLLHYEPAPNLRFRGGGGIGAYTFENNSWSARHRYRDVGFNPYRDEIEDEAGYHLVGGVDLVISGYAAFFLEVKHLFLDPDARLFWWREGTRDYEVVMQRVNLDTTFVNFGFRAMF